MHTWRLGLIGLLALVISSPALANITHVSINQRLFDVGKLPLLKINIVSNIKDSKRFQFLLQQQTGSERLMVNRINDFMLLVQGVEEVTDNQATLLVQEYRDNYWYDVARLPLFAADVPAGVPPEGIKLAMYKKPQAPTSVQSVQPSPVAESTAAEAASSQTVETSKLLAEPLKPEQIATQTANPNLANNSTANEQCVLDYNGKQTLWRLAKRYAKAWQTNVYAAALGILDSNPKAFYHGNPSSLRADAKLRCPSAEVLAQYGDKAAAEKKFDSLL